ncbi:MAG: cytochrome c3 family protein [Coriobacteriia bacterium]|nr:cytochrome c3 family protein [Coriobacteriia bacterium]
MTTAKKPAIPVSLKIMATSVVGILLAASVLTIGCSSSVPEDAWAHASNEQALSEALSMPVAWTTGSDCGACHHIEQDSQLSPEHPQAFAHQDEASCLDCHTELSVLAAAHLDLTFADALRTQYKSNSATALEHACIDCHGSMEEMALLTMSSTALTDSQKTTVNPHEQPAGPTHEVKVATCTDCHNNHSLDLQKDAMKYCASCHHRGVFTCGNCHEYKTIETVLE